jgi:pimeloyl-ACP methyl ester carboxylesterase
MFSDVNSVRDGVNSEELTGAELAFVSEAGHLPFAEQPEDFLLVATEFLSRHGLWDQWEAAAST